MTSHPSNSLSFETVDDIGFVEVADIDMGERLRPVDPVHVEVLGRAMMREGQATPIVVCRLPGSTKWTLVAGAHRVEAARKFGIESLKAELIGPDKIGRRQREISENLWRKGLDPIDRANFIAELVRLAKLRAGIDPDANAQRVAITARWQKTLKDQADDACDTMSHVYGWTDEVAEQSGLSRRTLSRDLILHTRLSPSAVEKLRRARPDIAANAKQLRDLARHDRDIQDKIVGQLLRDHPRLGRAPKSVAEAMACMDGRAKAPQDAETKRFNAFLGAYGRMGVAEKKGAIAHLKDKLPAGFSLTGPDDGIPVPADVRSGLEQAFAVLVQLVDGEPVDDDALHEACGLVQQALLTINANTGAAA